MKIIKFILGILFAFLIVAALVVGLAEADAFNDYMGKNETIDLIYHFVIVAVLFFILTMLSAYFVPTPKKIGVVISTVISYALAVFIIYRELFQMHAPLNLRLGASFAGLMAGLLFGILLSYKLFNNRGWDNPKNIESDPEY